MGMNDIAKRVLICNCEGTLPLDNAALNEQLPGVKTPECHQLCIAQIDRFEHELGDRSPLIVACTVQAPVFLEAAAEHEGAPPLTFVNIREKAGWSREGDQAGAKIAALLAEAAFDLPQITSVQMHSDGHVLVIGTDDIAVDAARQLAASLEVTLLLSAAGAEIAPTGLSDLPVFQGRVTGARGHLGAFRVEVDGLKLAAPSSRGRLEFSVAAALDEIAADLILDLRRDAPLVTAPEKRDGYFNPDPHDPVGVQKALFALSDMVGDFEKPQYVAYNPDICAHKRNGVAGCTLCLDNCPTGAILSSGDQVDIDPFICAGCGACTALCPSGAVSFRKPPHFAASARLKVLLGAYHGAGGNGAVLFVHDITHGEEVIEIMARHYDGLPARVLPIAVHSVAQCGLEWLLAAVAFGAARVVLLQPPIDSSEFDGLRRTLALAGHILGGLGYGEDIFLLLDEADPQAVHDRLWSLQARSGPAPLDFEPSGNRRMLMRQVLGQLLGAAPAAVERMALPDGAPFGNIRVNVDKCTLCLACVSSCPAGALKDNPDTPQLSFIEENCLQCGLCVATCPERVITLEPRLDFTVAAAQPRLVKEEAPFACVRCGKPFGTASSIEAVIAKLVDNPAFAEAGALERLRMCADCRVVAMAEQVADPLSGAPRPLTRTTDDYLRERDDDDEGE